jgi:hypothetical protein
LSDTDTRLGKAQPPTRDTGEPTTVADPGVGRLARTAAGPVSSLRVRGWRRSDLPHGLTRWSRAVVASVDAEVAADRVGPAPCGRRGSVTPQRPAAHGASELARALLDGFRAHDLLMYSSAISFQILTAIIPFLLFVLALAVAPTSQQRLARPSSDGSPSRSRGYLSASLTETTTTPMP